MHDPGAWAFPLAGAFLVCLSVLALVLLRARIGRKVPPAPTPKGLSVLAGLSFTCGLGALALLLVALVLAHVAAATDILALPFRDRAPLAFAARIVLYASLAPAVVAVAFALGARGAIGEAPDGLRGRSLYRAGLFLSLGVGLFAFQSRVAGPDFWSQDRGWSLRMHAPSPLPDPGIPRDR